MPFGSGIRLEYAGQNLKLRAAGERKGRVGGRAGGRMKGGRRTLPKQGSAPLLLQQQQTIAGHALLLILEASTQPCWLAAAACPLRTHSMTCSGLRCRPARCRPFPCP